MEQKTIAVVFPGQGSQQPGMGRDFYDNIPESRVIYEEASETLGWDVSAMCFGGDNRLDLTEYAQPSILTTEIAMLEGLRVLYRFAPVFFGGHSLGEYTALVAAGVLPLPEALRIVQIRGRLMQEAVPIGVGGMAAVISEGISVDMLSDILGDLPVDVANINSADQVVVSGLSSAMPEVESRLAATKGDRSFRFTPLNVSAPFHSRFMRPIEPAFEKALRSTGKGLAPGGSRKVTSNFSGKFYSGSPDELFDGLVHQLSNTVKWMDNMYALTSKADAIYEIGPGRPLRSFFKTIGVSCKSITTFASAKRIFEDRH